MNFKGILVRQIMTGIYKEPSPAYLAKLNEQKAIAADLQRFTGQTVNVGNDNEIVLTFSNLMNDMKKGI